MNITHAKLVLAHQTRQARKKKQAELFDVKLLRPAKYPIGKLGFTTKREVHQYFADMRRRRSDGAIIFDPDRQALCALAINHSEVQVRSLAASPDAMFFVGPGHYCNKCFLVSADDEIERVSIARCLPKPRVSRKPRTDNC